MKKIVIFENEFVEVEAAFSATNFFFYNNELEFKVYPSSQEAGDLNKLSAFDLIVVDLDLSLRSSMDGYAIIAFLLKNNVNDKIAILSGSAKESIREKLKNKGLPDIPIITKPVDFEDIYNKFKLYL